MFRGSVYWTADCSKIRTRAPRHIWENLSWMRLGSEFLFSLVHGVSVNGKNWPNLDLNLVQIVLYTIFELFWRTDMWFLTCLLVQSKVWKQIDMTTLCRLKGIFSVAKLSSRKNWIGLDISGLQRTSIDTLNAKCSAIPPFCWQSDPVSRAWSMSSMSHVTQLASQSNGDRGRH